MGGVGSGRRSYKQWTAQRLAAHRAALATRERAGLDLHYRHLTPEEIRTEYTTWRLASLLSVVNRKHEYDRLVGQLPIDPDAYYWR